MEVSASAPRDAHTEKVLNNWWAGFIEDAQDLHLATKKSFSVVVWFMLEDPVVYREFCEFAASGRKRVKQLIKSLRRAIRDENLTRMGASPELMVGGPPPSPAPSVAQPLASQNEAAVGPGQFALPLAAFAAGCAFGVGIAVPSPTRRPRRAERV
jgi:hypothetical protein